MKGKDPKKAGHPGAFAGSTSAADGTPAGVIVVVMVLAVMLMVMCADLACCLYRGTGLTAAASARFTALRKLHSEASDTDSDPDTASVKFAPYFPIPSPAMPPSVVEGSLRRCR